MFFFFNDTATTEIYTLSLHDALPIYSPRRSAGATAAASVAPSTVSTAKPRPRTAETAESQSSPSSTAYSGEGAPRATSPAASTGPGPNRAVSAGTADCPATVTARNTAVTTPAVSAAAPPATAYAGSEARVRVKLVKPSTVAPTSARTAGSRQSDVRASVVPRATPLPSTGPSSDRPA